MGDLKYYLTTYGWAILIIIIVAGTLAYYGIFSPEVLINSRFCYDNEIHIMRRICDNKCLVNGTTVNVTETHACYLVCFKETKTELGCGQ